MLRPLDRTRRDGPLYPGATRTLRDFIPPDHLVRRLDGAFDFGALAATLEQYYVPRLGRPAIHPEIVLRLLVLGLAFGVPSYRQLPDRLQENLAWRWFCHLSLEDPVPDHSTLSVFLDRVGPEAFQAVLAQLNQALLAAGLFSGHTYLDASLQPANVHQQDLQAMRPEERAELELEEAPDGTWHDDQIVPGRDGEPDRLCVVRTQDPEGQLPLPPHDPGARWRTQQGRTMLGYKHSVWTERGHFILAEETAGADVAEVDAALLLLERLPYRPSSVAADSGYRAGRFRTALRRCGIRSWIPTASNQDGGSAPGFLDHHDHVLCPRGVRLDPAGFPDEVGRVRFAAPVEACRVCPIKTTCITTTGRARKEVWISRYRLVIEQAMRQNAGRRYAREMRRRQTIAEGVFARLDRLAGARLRVRGLERVRSVNTLAALVHNLLTALTKRRFWRRGAAAFPVTVWARASSNVLARSST